MLNAASVVALSNKSPSTPLFQAVMSGRPEANFLSPTVTVPNSALPMLVYWPVLPVPHDQESAKQAFGEEKKKRLVSGQSLGPFSDSPLPFHDPRMLRGLSEASSHFLLGKGPLDSNVDGVQVMLNAGDIIVQPVGLA